jgi:hypothetical protein
MLQPMQIIKHKNYIYFIHLDEIGHVARMRYQKCVKCYGRKTWKDETTWNT